jgi:Tol biopolymer transport system component/DNA-binding winged helix-turn-helix (wHTH) protein
VISPELYDFEDVRVDVRRMVVLRKGAPVSLEPKAFDVLVFLIEHRDRLVTKDELLDAVWHDTFVTPNVLTRVVAQLRKALGDDAFEARYIETASRRGYRFIATVSVVDAVAPATTPAGKVDDHEPSPEASRSIRPGAHSRRRFAIAGASVVALIALAVALGFALRSSRSAEPSAQVRMAGPKRFTVGGSSYTDPAISLDGRAVAYVSDQTGSLELYVVGVAPGSKELAITADGGQNQQPAWSPDGQWLAYFSQKNGGVWVVQSSGGTPRRIVEFGSSPSWSPDGRSIVFTSDAGGMASQATLWTVSPDGSNLTQITHQGNPAGGHRMPVWSPDGSQIVFDVSEGRMGTETWLYSVKSQRTWRLGPGGFGSSRHFAPDGKSVLILGRAGDVDTQLYRLPVVGPDEPAPTPQSLVGLGSDFGYGLSVARDGTLVVALHHARTNLWTVEVGADGSGGSVERLTKDNVRSTYPTYSADGRIAFLQIVLGRPATTWVVNDDGRNREPLSAGLEESTLVAQWSPDGKRVLVVLGDGKDTHRFAWIDVATRQISAISRPLDDVHNLRLSPDGRQLAFHVIDPAGAMNVWKETFADGSRTQLTFDKEAISYPAWSWDGKWLAVEIKRGDSTYVGVLPSDGGTAEQLTFDKGQSWPNSWAPDNDRIAFAGNRDGVWNIFSVSKRSKAVKQLTRFTTSDYVRYPAWSPKGNRIVFEAEERVGSIWTLKLP